MAISLWDVKAAVLTALTAALVPDTADLVTMPRPPEEPALSQPRRVYIGAVINVVPQPIWEPSSQIRTEEYVVPLMVECLSMTGNDPAGAATAAGQVAAIVAAIETQIGDDPSWNATCDNSGLSVVAENTAALGDAPSGSGWQSWAILELHVQHRGR